jgi:membrane protease YdiL (CAAX protease family)
VANVPSGFIQEVIFRGTIFRITRDWLGVWRALAISSILFGLIHILSATATIQSVIAITLEAGVLLAGAYMLTNRWWLPIGVHVAWDFANDGIFGVGLSGETGETIRGCCKQN